MYIMLYSYDDFHSLSGEHLGKSFETNVFTSRKKMLEYLQKNIYSEETKKPFNFKTLKSYNKLGIYYRKVKRV